MKQYYLHDGQNQIGPFSIEELKEKNITGETYIWKEGMSDWQKANEVVELNSILGIAPPPFKASTVAPVTQVSQSKAYKKGIWIGRNPIASLMILILVIVTGLLIINNSHSVARNYIVDPNDTIKNLPLTPAEIRHQLEQKEKENPLDYLTSKITMRENLIGEKVFEGSISNGASIATFKDITIKISYLSKTQTVIGEKEFIVYETIRPNNSVSIGKIKTSAPSATDGFSITIVSALPVE